MSRLDATAAAYVENNELIRPVHFVFLDFLSSPVRACDAGINIDVSGQTQPDLNGLYTGVTADVGSVSPIKVSDGGSSPVSVKLSGLRDLDDEMLSELYVQGNWKGRLARIWRVVWDQNNAQQGSYQHLYTGYMDDLLIAGDITQQVIEITIENYLVAFSQASGRTYQNSRDYDPNDWSGDAAITAANGNGDRTLMGFQGSGSGFISALLGFGYRTPLRLQNG